MELGIGVIRSAVVHCIRDRRDREGRETGKKTCDMLFSAVVYCSSQSQAGVISLELGHAHIMTHTDTHTHNIYTMHSLEIVLFFVTWQAASM